MAQLDPDEAFEDQRATAQDHVRRQPCDESGCVAGCHGHVQGLQLLASRVHRTKVSGLQADCRQESAVPTLMPF